MKRTPRMLQGLLILALSLSGLALIVYGLAPSQEATKEVPTSEPIMGGPNILLVTLCSMRADRVGNQYTRKLTPNLDHIAREGISFTRAYANATTTLPAHASLLTGVLPDRHGVIDFETRLSTALPSLPGVLGLYGYRRAWVMESNSSEGSNGSLTPARPPDTVAPPRVMKNPWWPPWTTDRLHS